MGTTNPADRARSALKTWREEQGLSQEQAVAPLKMHQASWSGWETGDKTPPFEIAARLELMTGGRVRVEDFGYEPGPAIDLAASPWRAELKGSGS